MKNLKPRNIKSEKRRKQIIRSALACFIELGFNDANMEDIRKRSCASTGSIYHHFKNKKQLAAAVYLEGIRDYQQGLVETLEENEHAREGIFAVISYHMKWVENNQEWSRFLFQERHADFMGNSEEEFNSLNEKFILGISRWIDKQIKAGSIRKLPRDLYMAILMGPCQEYTRLYIYGLSCTSLGDAVDILALAAWQALGTDTE
jgi:AcrR family transcriptional regulator